MKSFIFCISLSLVVYSNAITERELTTLIDQLLANYNGGVRPNFEGEPVHVNISVQIEEISNLRESDMEFEISMFLRQYWNDPRLIVHSSILTSPVHLDDKVASIIWKPDIYIVNQKKSEIQSLEKEHKFLRLSPYGDVLLSYKIFAKLSCPMDLRQFPFDTQSCGVMFETYGSTADEVLLHWKDKDDSISHLALRNFKIIDIGHYDYILNFLTGQYPNLELKFDLERLSGHYILNNYFPTILIVFISFITFWIDDRSEILRSLWGMLSFLAILLSSTNASIVQTNFITALDLWNWFCTVIVFFSLVEFAVVTYLHRKKQPANERNISKDSATLGELSISESNNQLNYPHIIDVISRIGFPAVFFLFMILYYFSV